MVKPLGESRPLKIDEASPIEGMTYRDLVKELDELPSLGSDWEIGFVADAIDHPETFFTKVQLEKIVELWRRRCDAV